jgi:hypothetical protein
MISAVGSNTLTILPGVSVTPRKTRAVVCRSTWLTSGIIASNSCFIPCGTALLFLIHHSLHSALDLLGKPLRLVSYLP